MFVCFYVRTHMCLGVYLHRREQRVSSPEAGIIERCKSLSVGAGKQISSLKNQQVLLTTGPSLQPLMTSF